jgi:hypothetical protein
VFAAMRLSSSIVKFRLTLLVENSG